MLGLFRQKNTADEFVNCLRGHYGDTIELITQLDEPFQPLYEAGLFVASIAILKILALNKKIMRFLLTNSAANGWCISLKILMR